MIHDLQNVSAAADRRLHVPRPPGPTGRTLEPDPDPFAPRLEPDQISILALPHRRKPTGPVPHAATEGIENGSRIYMKGRLAPHRVTKGEKKVSRRPGVSHRPVTGRLRLRLLFPRGARPRFLAPPGPDSGVGRTRAAHPGGSAKLFCSRFWPNLAAVAPQGRPF